MSTTQDLLLYLFGQPDYPLFPTFDEWIDRAPRFRTFLENYRDKIRKKARIAQGDDRIADLHAELAVAYLLLQDQRCMVEYEKLGVGQQRAPDLTVIFKTHTPFHVEVTRLRAVHPNGQSAALAKLANTLCDKLGQLPPSAINLLACVTSPAVYKINDVQDAFLTLQTRAIQKEDAFFQRRGLDNGRRFQRQQQRLSAVLLGAVNQSQWYSLDLWPNPQTRHPLSLELRNLFRQLCL